MAAVNPEQNSDRQAKHQQHQSAKVSCEPTDSGTAQTLRGDGVGRNRDFYYRHLGDYSYGQQIVPAYFWLCKFLAKSFNIAQGSSGSSNLVLGSLLVSGVSGGRPSPWESASRERC